MNLTITGDGYLFQPINQKIRKNLVVSFLFINFAVFNMIEHNNSLNTMSNQEILNSAVAALNRNIYAEKAKVVYDGDIPILNLMGKRFVCIIDPNLTPGKMTAPIPEDDRHSDKDVRYLYVTVNANPKMLEIAKLSDINVLDCAGNFNIQYQQKDGKIFLMLSNKGEKPVKDTSVKSYPIFMEKGLRVIFYLLMDKKNISLPYREIVEATGASIGTVKNIIDGMVDQQFVRIENNKRFLINTDRLLMLWTANYSQFLKPKLLQTRFAFRDTEKQKDWMTVALPEGMVWGGESAAAFINGYLTPGEFTVYTDIPASNLLKTRAVLPDANGDIIVYHKFWKGEDNANVTPAILTYADLMNTANGRCIEVAQKIKESL